MIYKVVLIIICRYSHFERRLAINKHCTHDTFKGKDNKTLCVDIMLVREAYTRDPEGFYSKEKQVASQRKTLFT